MKLKTTVMIFLAILRRGNIKFINEIFKQVLHFCLKNFNDFRKKLFSKNLENRFIFKIFIVTKLIQS